MALELVELVLAASGSSTGASPLAEVGLRFLVAMVVVVFVLGWAVPWF